MNLREVYRVENAEGQGPYRPDGPANGFNHSCVNSHPTPHNDGIPCPEEYVCGFTSREQLKEWFDATERTTLRAEGYMIALYIVPGECVVDGKKQLVFDPSKADLAFRETL